MRSQRALHSQSLTLHSSSSPRVRGKLRNLRGSVGMGAFIPGFQLPNLPLFTLKDILLPSCTGSLYITLMLCKGAPLGIPSLEGKECLVLSRSIPDCGCFGSRPCQQKGPPSKSAREVRDWEGSCCKAKGLPCSRSFTLPFFTFLSTPLSDLGP